MEATRVRPNVSQTNLGTALEFDVSKLILGPYHPVNEYVLDK